MHSARSTTSIWKENLTRSGRGSSSTWGTNSMLRRSPESSPFKNWAITTRRPRPAARRASPKAAVVLPLPGPW